MLPPFYSTFLSFLLDRRNNLNTSASMSYNINSIYYHCILLFALQAYIRMGDKTKYIHYLAPYNIRMLQYFSTWQGLMQRLLSLLLPWTGLSNTKASTRYHRIIARSSAPHPPAPSATP